MYCVAEWQKIYSCCVNILHVVKHVMNYSTGRLLLVRVLNILKAIKHIAGLMTDTHWLPDYP